jgi:AraC family transcriptional regulator, transcriptional activator FtrA
MTSRAPGAEPRAHVVAAIVPEHAAAFELAVALEVFAMDRSELVDPWYEMRVIGAEGPEVVLTGGYVLSTPDGIESLADADTIVVPAWRGYSNVGTVSEPLREALWAAHDRGARLMSFCTGAFLLAEVGLLDGRRATTHWYHSAELARMYPHVRVDPSVLYVCDGNVLTSAGTAAAIDLSLHVVRMDHGAEVANAVARRMVVPPHRDGGQAQYVDMPIGVDPEPDAFHATLTWLLDHLDEPTSVDDLAARSLMSPRSFARRFRQVTGTSPHQWILRQRVIFAQRLLEATDDSVERIAQRAGFGSAATLRMHFQRVVQTTPLAYRRTFSGMDEAAAG